MFKETFMQNLLVNQLDAYNSILSPFVSQLFQSTDLKRFATSKPLIYKSKKEEPSSIKNLIFQWFHNLNIQERQKYTSIENQALVQLLILYSHKFHEDFFKVSIQHDSRTQISSENIFRSRTIHISCKKEKKESQKELIKNCRIHCLRNPRIFLLRQFLSNQIQFFQHLQNISNCQIFEYGAKQIKKQQIFDNPLWFSSYSFNSVGQWICCGIEKNLIMNYCKDKKQNLNLMNCGLNYQIQLINYYEKLNEKVKKQFWSGIFQISKKQTLISLKQFIEYEPTKITLEKLKSIQNKIIHLQQIYQQQKLNEMNLSDKKNFKKSKNIKTQTKQKLVKQIHKKYEQKKNNQQLNIQKNIESKQSQLQIIFHQKDIQQQCSRNSHIENSVQQDLEPITFRTKLEPNQNQICYIHEKNQLPENFAQIKLQKKSLQTQKEKQKVFQAKQEIKAPVQIQECLIHQESKKIQNIVQSSKNCDQIQSCNQTVLQLNKLNQTINLINQVPIFQSKNHNSNLQCASIKQTNEIVESHSTSDSVQDDNKKNKKKLKKKKKFTDQFLQHLFEQLLETNLQKLVDDLSDHSNRLLNARILTFERIRNFIMKIYGQYTVDAKLFGSNAVGLALPTSDIDIFLTGFSLQTQEQSIQCLERISSQLKKMKWVIKCESYLKAKIPIIKLQINPNIKFLDIDDKQNELQIIKNMKENLDLEQPINQIIKVDITIEAKRADYSHLGILSTDFMKNWLISYPTLHPIVLTLKYILSVKGLNKPFKGGLSSYCLFIMSAAYIKQFYALNKDQKNVGVIFLKLLQFYSEDFDNQSSAISLFLNQNSFYIHQLQKSSLTIIDPLNARIMTGNCYKFCEIKQEFKRIKTSLTEYKQMIYQDLNELNAIEIKGLIQKKKLSDKWLKRYQQIQDIQLQKIINN